MTITTITSAIIACICVLPCIVDAWQLKLASSYAVVVLSRVLEVVLGGRGLEVGVGPGLEHITLAIGSWFGELGLGLLAWGLLEDQITHPY